MAMKKRKIRLALAQMANAGSIKNNLSKSIQLLKAAAENKADLVLFSEVQLTEFFRSIREKMSLNMRFHWTRIS